MNLFKHIQKKDIIFFLLGALIFCSIGTVVATNISASEFDYTTTKNNSVENVEDALDDLYGKIIEFPVACYNGVCGKISYRYWNNDFAGNSGVNYFDSNHMPTTAYATRSLLEQNYGLSNFENSPVYIRSILINGNVVGHQVCLWKANNQKEFCFAPGYWAGTIGTNDATVGENTKIKLERDMQSALSLNISDINCESYSSYTSCIIGGHRCSSNALGLASCRSDVTMKYCHVNISGAAYCSI